MNNVTQPKISLRPVREEDPEFLYEVYFSTRQAEVEQFGWDRPQVEAFVRMQFNARQAAYKMRFPLAVHEVIIVGETPAGRLIVDRSDGQILLTDIAVLPQFQGKGVASHVVRGLQKEAATSGALLILHVDKINAYAIGFYKNLGFETVAETQLMNEMKWTAARELIDYGKK